MTDRALLRALQGGNADALEKLIDRYAAYASTVVYNIIGEYMTREDVEEVTSDVFLALWQNAEKANAGNFKAYLGSIARNKAKNKLRGFMGYLPLEDDAVIVADGSPEDAFTRCEQRRTVRRAVLSMQARDREIFLRHYYACQPVSRIAREMGMNVSAVKMRLCRGREKLQQMLQKELSEGGCRDEEENFGIVGLS